MDSQIAQVRVAYSPSWYNCSFGKKADKRAAGPSYQAGESLPSHHNLRDGKAPGERDNKAGRACYLLRGQAADADSGIPFCPSSVFRASASSIEPPEDTGGGLLLLCARGSLRSSFRHFAVAR